MLLLREDRRREENNGGRNEASHEPTGKVQGSAVRPHYVYVLGQMHDVYLLLKCREAGFSQMRESESRIAGILAEKTWKIKRVRIASPALFAIIDARFAWRAKPTPSNSRRCRRQKRGAGRVYRGGYLRRSAGGLGALNAFL